jgi:hypothetical protein
MLSEHMKQNLVALPVSRHVGLHTYVYYDYITLRLQNAIVNVNIIYVQQLAITATLRIIALELRRGTFMIV